MNKNDLLQLNIAAQALITDIKKSVADQEHDLAALAHNMKQFDEDNAAELDALIQSGKDIKRL